MKKPRSKAEVLEEIGNMLANNSEIMGVGVIADGININFVGEQIWWRVELSDITARLHAAFTRHGIIEESKDD